MLPSMADVRERFRELHARDGVFVMPNAWDLGSARLLASLGFEALATTSSGHAWSLGKDDHAVTLDELVAHVAALVQAVDVPISVDSEQLFDDPAATVRALAEAGAAGCSVEDYDAAGAQDDLASSIERVGAAAEAAHRDGLVLTARCESHLFPNPNLDETIARLAAYRDAGADVVYAPGLVDAGEIAAVVAGVGVPVNVLLRPNGPSVPELGALGVRRVSTGGSLASASYAALLAGSAGAARTGNVGVRAKRLDAGRPARARRRSGAEGDRTPDLRHAMAALSQLSYGPRKTDCSGEFVVLPRLHRIRIGR